MSVLFDVVRKMHQSSCYGQSQSGVMQGSFEMRVAMKFNNRHARGPGHGLPSDSDRHPSLAISKNCPTDGSRFAVWCPIWEPAGTIETVRRGIRPRFPGRFERLDGRSVSATSADVKAMYRLECRACTGGTSCPLAQDGLGHQEVGLTVVEAIGYPRHRVPYLVQV